MKSARRTKRKSGGQRQEAAHDPAPRQGPPPGSASPPEESRATLLRQQAILDNIPDIAWLKDRDGRFVAVNEPFGQACGLAPAVVVGKTDHDVWPRELAERYRADDEEVMRSRARKRVEERLVDFDGTESWIETIKTPILDERGTLVGTAGIARDITERRASEEELRRRTRGLATLLDVSRNLAATLDLQTVLQAATDGATRLFGLDTAAVYLREDDRLGLCATTPPLPPGFPEELRNAPLADHPHLRRTLEAGDALFVADIAAADLTPAERAVTKQRGLRSVLYLPLVAGVKSVGALIVGSIGKPKSLAAPEIDLCRTLANLAALAVENSRLYASGQRYAAQLEHTLADRTRVEEERLELERRLLHAQKLESLGVLAGGIAHDFNNLLMAVLGNLDLARLRLPTDAPAREHLEKCALAARRATDLTRQMLAYSGKGRFVVEPVDLNALVEENAALFRASVARTATIEVRLERPLPPVMADEGQVQQVIMNLITNASEALGDKPGGIFIRTGVQVCDGHALARSRIEEVPPEGTFVALEVSDTGCGMDEETQQRLFDPFFTTKAAGRGLGMSAILGIVRGHHGAIFLESAAGKGTSVRILFPACAAGTAAGPRTAMPASADGAEAAPGAVLVVDDEEGVRNVCRDMVASFGYQALTAADGDEAIELFRRHADRISHVVLDLSMPKMDGLSALRELLRIKPDVKVILSSGYNARDSVRRLCGRRGTRFIQKPYTIETLRAALTEAGGPGP